VLKRIVNTAGLLILFSMVVGISGYFTLTLIIKSEDTVVIPDLVGKDVVYALEILSSLGLNTKVKGSEYSSRIPKNHVIFQEPEPGDEIKKGRDIRIIISKGDQSVIMPNLKGLSIQQARIILEENDLGQGVLSTTYNKQFKRDDIIEQYPLSGSMINRNNEVDLLVSMGQRPNAYKMPDLSGLAIYDAIMLIEQNRLLVGEIKSVFDENRPKNIVAGQNPPAGDRVNEGSIVNLELNRKPGKARSNISQGVRLFRYRLDEGFLKKRVKARLNCFGVSSVIHDDLLKPDKELWVLIPNNMDATVSIYEDNELIETEVFDLW
jgi:beta-lactam-binding protein with PASTA domain